MTTHTTTRPSVLGALILVAVLAAACSAGAAASPTPTAAPTTTPVVTPTAAPTSSPTAAPTSTTAEATGSARPHGARGYGGGSSSPSAAVGVIVAVGTTSSGPVLVGPSGNTLYILAGDSTSNSSCAGGCLAAWPPLLVMAGGTVAAGPGVTGKLSTFKRSDGTIQVAYKGHPLYYFVGDSPGAASGRGQGGFTAATP